MFELALGLDKRGLVDDAFLLLRWLGEHYARWPDPALAVRVIMGVTDDCMTLGSRDAERNLAARRVLRAVVDSAPRPTCIEPRGRCAGRWSIVHIWAVSRAHP